MKYIKVDCGKCTMWGISSECRNPRYVEAPYNQDAQEGKKLRSCGECSGCRTHFGSGGCQNLKGER
jgi:hypothetical protein